MKADPEAYQQYFDFYLKYYTQKYEHQPPPRNYCVPPPRALPSAFSQLNTFSAPPPTFQSSGLHTQPPKFKLPPVLLDSGARKENSSAVNESNLENARKIQAEIREEARSGGLSALAAYDDSDSDE